MRYEYVYDTHASSRRLRQRRLKRIRKFFFSLFILLICLVIFFFIFKKARSNNLSQEIISPLAQSFNASVDTVKKIINPSSLDSVVKKSLNNTNGTYAVAIKNLKTGEAYYLSKNKKFESASLYKLWVMVVAFRLIEKGQLDPDKVLVEDITDLNIEFNIATDDAELTEGTFELSVERAIKQMIVVSNNYAALSLINEIRSSNIEKFLKDEGFINSTTNPLPTTTASDIASFFEKLYVGKLAGKESTAKMIEILKNQQINDRLPKYLPEKIEVAHKTGELDKVKHDGGIVFTQKGDYVIVVLSESDSPKKAAEREAQLSKSVYEYFEKR